MPSAFVVVLEGKGDKGGLPALPPWASGMPASSTLLLGPIQPGAVRGG